MKGKKFRILMINDHIHFGGGGDAAFQLERLAYENAGYAVYTFSESDTSAGGWGEYDRVYLESGNRFVKKAGKFLFDYGVYNALRGVVESISPDLIKVHLVSKYPASVYAALSYADCPVIQILHGPNLFCATAWGCYRKDSQACEMGIDSKCYRNGCVSLPACMLHIAANRLTMPFVMKNVDLFLCPSAHLLKSVRDLGLGEAELLPLGIDPEFSRATPVPFEGPPTILYVGALIVQKGIHFLLEAFRIVKTRIPEARLVLAGAGEFRSALEAQAARLGLGQEVEFKGFVDRSRILPVYQKAHVLAVPSVWKEQFGLVGPEALACGVPCVGSDIGGIPEWLHDGEWGFLVPPREASMLADRLIAVLVDGELRMRFAAKGREFVLREFPPEKYQANVLRYAETYIGTKGTRVARGQ